jgi:hypothetical protein
MSARSPVLSKQLGVEFTEENSGGPGLRYRSVRKKS